MGNQLKYNTRQLRFAYCYRENLHSKGSDGHDHRILNMVISNIRSAGFECQNIDLADIRHLSLDDYCLLLSMSRSTENLSLLASLKSSNCLMLNNPEATMMTLRENMYSLFEKCAVPVPESTLFDLENDTLPDFPFWIKRKDYHHITALDVSCVKDKITFEKARKHFMDIGYRSVYIQEHVEGIHVKYYGVFDRLKKKIRFLNSVAPDSLKMGRALKNKIEEFLTMVPIEIFGCDVIHGDREYVVDFNSWPSFKTCQDEAAKVIGEYALELVVDYE